MSLSAVFKCDTTPTSLICHCFLFNVDSSFSRYTIVPWCEGYPRCFLIIVMHWEPMDPSGSLWFSVWVCFGKNRHKYLMKERKEWRDQPHGTVIQTLPWKWLWRLKDYGIWAISWKYQSGNSTVLPRKYQCQIRSSGKIICRPTAVQTGR